MPGSPRAANAVSIAADRRPRPGPCGTSATLEPPNPPPVIRAPSGTGLRPPSSTARSSSGAGDLEVVAHRGVARRRTARRPCPVAAARASTVASTRSISVTTWRARRRTRSSSSLDRGRSAWRSGSTPSAAAARLAVGAAGGVPAVDQGVVTRVSVTSRVSPAAARRSGDRSRGVVVEVDEQRRAGLGAAATTVWSIPPVGAPATSVSARDAGRDQSVAAAASSSSSRRAGRRPRPRPRTPAPPSWTARHRAARCRRRDVDARARRGRPRAAPTARRRRTPPSRRRRPDRGRRGALPRARRPGALAIRTAVVVARARRRRTSRGAARAAAQAARCSRCARRSG